MIRLEEFIECHVITPEDRKNVTIRKHIAKKVARIHNTELPMTRKVIAH